MKDIVVGKKEFDPDKIAEIFNGLDVRESTRKEYKYFVRAFLLFIEQEGLNSHTFRMYKTFLANNSRISISTKNKYLTSARIFLKEMSRLGVIPIDITHNTKSFSQNKKHRREGLSEAEVHILVEKINTSPSTSKATRIKAMISLLALQGLRQCEVVRLDVSDLDLANRIGYIKGKGMDDKEPVHLHPETVAALAEYLKRNKVADGALFSSLSNNNRNQRLSTAALRALIKESLIELGIVKSVHGFRHYFTTKLINTYKGDLLEVARYTRHKSLEMLQVYNDNIKARADLPRYYQAFADISFTNKNGV